MARRYIPTSLLVEVSDTTYVAEVAPSISVPIEVLLDDLYHCHLTLDGCAVVIGHTGDQASAGLELH